MKNLLFGLALAGVGVGSVQAQQIYVPQAVANGTILGAIAGALIGGHNHDRWGEGAVIGGVAGAIFGAAANQPTREVIYATPAPVYPAQAPVYAPPPAAVPTVQDAQPQVVYVERPAQPTVVYVERPAPPRVIYVVQPPRVIYVTPPPRYVYVEAPPRRGPPGRR